MSYSEGQGDLLIIEKKMEAAMYYLGFRVWRVIGTFNVS